MPKDPMPEYKSNILEFSILVFIKFECFKILNIFSYRVFKRTCVEFFVKFIDLPFNDPLIILIFYLLFSNQYHYGKNLFPIYSLYI